METGVQRWAVNTRLWSPSESQFAAFLDLLPASERPLVLRYIKFEDKKRALVSRLLQRKLVYSLLKIDYDVIVIERTNEGKPYLDFEISAAAILNSAQNFRSKYEDLALWFNGAGDWDVWRSEKANQIKSSDFPNLNFNVSHHGSYVALASEPLCIVGVDIMNHEPIWDESPAEFFKPFRNCYTKSEWEMVLSAGPEPGPLLDQFYRLWCLKEAYIKAVGIGLGFDLLKAEFFYPGGNIWGDVAHVRINSRENTDWRFYLHKLGNDHWTCVARGPSSDAVGSYKKTLSKFTFNAPAFATALTAPEKAFTVLEVWDLIPDERKSEFLTIRI